MIRSTLAMTTIIGIASIALSACEAPQSQEDTADLRAQIEQLENQLGRLEFRIFELENAVGQQSADTATIIEPVAEVPATKPPAAAGRYDLTPVE